MGDPEEDMEGEGDEQAVELPELWKYVSPTGPDGTPGPGPLIGKITKYLNEKEDEELLEELAKLNPGTGQSLLMWAVLQQKFILVEWLLKKAKRAAFVFSDADKEMTVYDKFVEKRKEREQEEKEKAEAIAAGEAEPEEDDPDKEPPPLLHELVKADLGEDEGIDEFKIRRVGELGVYQGMRNPANNAKTGLGKSLYVNGDAYVGEYKDNKRHGVGCYWWVETGEMYIGEWRNNQRNGTGRMTYQDGGRYYGSWRYDERVGNGRYTYPTGDTYAGEWEAGVKHGHGTYTLASDSSQCIGTYVDGRFVTGEWRLAGGTRYFGVFNHYKPVGRGVFFHKHGQEGAYLQEGEYDGEGMWVPSHVRSLTDDSPSLDITVQGKVVTLTCTPQLNASVHTLVQVANFAPLEEWFAKIADSAALAKGFNLTGLELRSVDWGADRLLRRVGLGVRATDKNGERWSTVGFPEPETLSFTQSTTLLVPVLTCNGEERLVYAKRPLMAAGDMQASVLLDVKRLPSGDVASPQVATLKQLGVELEPHALVDVSKLAGNDGGTYTHPVECDTRHRVLYFCQEVTQRYWAMLDQKLADANGEGSGPKPLVTLHACPPAKFAAQSPCAASIAALHLIEALRPEKRLPTRTAEPMRPPTPPPPMAEARPEMPEAPPEDIPPPEPEKDEED